MARLLTGIIALFMMIGPARADFRFDGPEDVQAYVESNLLGVFYHELGHALIDILDLPIFGQEEDAADVLSIFLLDAFYEEEDAVQLAYDTAFGFLGEAEASGQEPVYWDVHGPDLQRYYNLVCVFFGANPDEREDVAQDLGLPDERAESCEDEYAQANGSWGAVLDEIAHPKGSNTIVLNTVDTPSEGAELTHLLIEDEINALNAEFKFPQILNVSVEPCGEANAFYDPEAKEIVMCSEFADYLVEIMP